MTDEGKKAEYSYHVDLHISRVLTETEKNLLMLKVSDAIDEVLGKPLGGGMLIYSKPKE